MKHGIRYISISKPCTENWDAMLPAAKGRYCSGCQKSVIDFSLLSNDEVLAILSSSTNVCGKFGENQLAGLNNQLSAPQRTLWWKKLSLAAAIAGIFPFFKADAQVKTNVDQYQSDHKAVLKNIETHLQIISGRVIDQASKQPIFGAELTIKGSTAIAITDTAGRFEISTSSNVDSILLCSDLAHIRKEIEIEKNRFFYNIEIAPTNLQPLVLQHEPIFFIGGVDTMATDIKKPDDTEWLIMRIFR